MCSLCDDFCLIFICRTHHRLQMQLSSISADNSQLKNRAQNSVFRKVFCSLSFFFVKSKMLCSPFLLWSQFSLGFLQSQQTFTCFSKWTGQACNKVQLSVLCTQQSCSPFFVAETATCLTYPLSQSSLKLLNLSTVPRF